MTDTLLDVLRRDGLPITAEPASVDARAGRTAWSGAVFNGAVDPHPLGVVECVDEAAVQTALRIAADHAVPVSVLAGGHDISGRGMARGNLVLDLRRMTQVDVDRAALEVTVGGGALTSDLLAGLPDELVTVTGTILSVGVTGLTLAGGYGRLNSRFGLASDGMKRARVVLADGAVVTASETEHADLFWALRGGGSGFGVVTALTTTLHHLPRVWTAMILVSLDQARDGLLLAQELIDQHPVELSIFMGFMTAPTGQPMLFLAPLWSGDPNLSGTLLERLTRDGAHVAQQGWGPYKATFDPERENARPKGLHYHTPTRTLSRVDHRAAEMLVDGARRMTSPHSAIVLHDFHGEPTRMPRNATAFPLRDDHFVVELLAAWEHGPSEDDDRHRHWAEDLSTDLSRLAIPGGYVNLLTPDEGDRVRLFYGPAARRLRAVKTRVDPDDLFRSGIGRLTGPE